MKDYRTDRLRTDWWSHRVVFGLTRNDISMILLILVLGVVYYNLDWNWIFGRR